jgi:hypothetical protein
MPNFYDIERRKPKWTFIFIAVCAVAFIFQIILPIENFLAFVPYYAVARPWTFITSIFLHANVQHIFFNMFALFIFGISLESRISERNFLLIFFLSGIVGNIGYMLTAPDSLIPGIGASGSIYGLVGALALLAPLMTVYYFWVPMPMILLAVVWTASEFFGLFTPSDIAHGAHIGGMIMGAIIGYYLRKQASKRYFKIFTSY